MAARVIRDEMREAQCLPYPLPVGHRKPIVAERGGGRGRAFSCKRKGLDQRFPGKHDHDGILQALRGLNVCRSSNPL